MLLKAVLPARLSSDTTTVMIMVAKIALSGIGVPTLMTFRKRWLPGKPSSRAKAHICLEPAATTLRLPQMPNAVTMDTIAIVPAVLPVAV
jgi:hypothetical protein